ncbi:hypothetical protein BC628DRAFT_1430062 [Trametes gibbosa]|nr:hypothetical protein BC628DRAFT_1430062 [Trametes gibbosa]
MPRLRVLELKFLLSEGCDFRWPLLPPAYAGPWPWPDLQHLTVSCPELGDKAWNHLPPTLQSLTLRYTPHLCDFTARGARGYPTIVGWQWPLLSSSQVLQLLRRCDLPALRHLGLEYSADGEELELLEFIGSAFPAMASLKIYRYRASEVADVPVGDIARALGSPPSSRLRTLALSLNLPDTPPPRAHLHSRWARTRPLPTMKTNCARSCRARCRPRRTRSPATCLRSTPSGSGCPMRTRGVRGRRSTSVVENKRGARHARGW